ncbi:hypothetical protein PWEIH_10903 [Listeria weihenstephanensis FSL R9-0317]|uniref:DUF1801 domain-containing protein n=1 Tax=Listeria weihenstephanensis TaxID=1006155 RepID=A0A1S7FVC6_9LIST|nr:DUF1801 domain-containing protein [Listeria weihenstephanensis]AQY51388.1 hypothetical protein UE46_10175 [Listeria weihenstephanensis]EUJ37191.1 hypothetical protein PWEIH_10903 [Listeria weihenstephanensis FSL R9-0317]MBC1500819.1 DUF1801 domain-containing protein [Listeria weihenstephanensis]
MATMNNEMQLRFEQYPDPYRERLLEIRELIMELAKQVVPIATVAESLKWSQPSYVVKGGTPIRIDRFEEENIALFFHCQTTLIATFRDMFSDTLHFSRNRAIILDPRADLPIQEISMCIQMALTYHKK